MVAYLTRGVTVGHHGSRRRSYSHLRHVPNNMQIALKLRCLFKSGGIYHCRFSCLLDPI